jgi:hypothetical protein
MKGKHEGNLAVSLLHQILGGEDVKSVSRALTLELEEPWFDDVAIVVMSL